MPDPFQRAKPDNRMVHVTDVTLREYGQNVPADQVDVFSPVVRVRIARELMRAGLTSLEVLSCVHPRVAPAMSLSALNEVASGLGRVSGVRFITLVPNRAGYRAFLETGLGPDGWNHVLGLFFSAVEAHNRLNLGRGIADTLEEYALMARDAVSRGIRMVGYVSAAFGYQESGRGSLLRPTVRELSAWVDLLIDLGVETVTLSDLQGVAEEQDTRMLWETLLEARQGRDRERLGYHPHHVSGDQAVANSEAAWNAGIRRFDASLGGTGGCVTGAPGNQPTEGLVRRFHARGIATGIDEDRLGALSDWVRENVYTKAAFRGESS
jgi:hydroxymethylglutaryl-CoA lyase